MFEVNQSLEIGSENSPEIRPFVFDNVKRKSRLGKRRKLSYPTKTENTYKEKSLLHKQNHFNDLSSHDKENRTAGTEDIPLTSKEFPSEVKNNSVVNCVENTPQHNDPTAVLQDEDPVVSAELSENIKDSVVDNNQYYEQKIFSHNTSISGQIPLSSVSSTPMLAQKPSENIGNILKPSRQKLISWNDYDISKFIDANGFIEISKLHTVENPQFTSICNVPSTPHSLYSPQRTVFCELSENKIKSNHKPLTHGTTIARRVLLDSNSSTPKPIENLNDHIIQVNRGVNDQQEQPQQHGFIETSKLHKVENPQFSSICNVPNTPSHILYSPQHTVFCELSENNIKSNHKPLTHGSTIIGHVPLDSISSTPKPIEKLNDHSIQINRGVNDQQQEPQQHGFIETSKLHTVENPQFTSVCNIPNTPSSHVYSPQHTVFCELSENNNQCRNEQHLSKPLTHGSTISGRIPLGSVSSTPKPIEKPNDHIIHVNRNLNDQEQQQQPYFAVPQELKPSIHANTNNYITIKGVSYHKLSKLGEGGSSKVYQVLHPNPDEDMSHLLAVKEVNLSKVEESVAQSYLNEVQVLKRLQNCDCVIKMLDSELVFRKGKKLLYVVMEKGDTDLSSLIKRIDKTTKISIPMIIYYWTEMLTAVNEIHNAGIIHSDLKPANFLLVSGRLKLIDFGIASRIRDDMTSVHVDTPMGTLSYMSPEAIRNISENGASDYKITKKSDVWSLGCILYNLVYRCTPFQGYKSTMSKMAAIKNLKVAVEFPEKYVPPVLMAALRWCLQKDWMKRPTVSQLLQLPYHTGVTMVPHLSQMDLHNEQLPPVLKDALESSIRNNQENCGTEIGTLLQVAYSVGLSVSTSPQTNVIPQDVLKDFIKDPTMCETIVKISSLLELARDTVSSQTK